MKKKETVQETITREIVEALEKGVRPWAKPWHCRAGSGSFPIRHNGEQYKGINIIALWASQLKNGFASNQWMTANQANQLGGNQVRGEKPTTVCFFKPITIDKDTKDEKKIPLARAFRVFNVDQLENLPDRFYPEEDTEEEPTNQDNNDYPNIELYFDNLPVHHVNNKGSRACYAPDLDLITMPEQKDFKSNAHYFTTLGHETIHWTGHAGRLDRDLKNQFGSQKYGKEELIAELGAAFLAAQWGISSHTKEESESYLASWIQTMKKEPKFLFQAASAAQKAVTFLNDKQPIEERKAA